MRFSEKTDYGFAVGQVRAKETLLIRRQEYERLLHFNSEAELLSTVQDIWHFESGERSSIENLLNIAEQENRAFFAKYCLDKIVQELFFDSVLMKNRQLAGYLKILNNEFLNQYFTTAIDLENLRNFLRIKNLAEKEKLAITEQRNLFRKFYWHDGTIPEPTFVALLTEPWESILHWADNLAYRPAIAEGINYLLNQKSFLRFERLVEEEKQKVLIKARYATFGYEPLVAYYLFKDNEIKNLRKIFYGIIEKTPIEQLRESIACIL